MKLKRRVYSKLVGLIPIREVAGDEVDATLQELPNASPQSAILVPQGDNEVADRERRLLLMDAALTPPKMPGAYGLPSWAVDCARMLRAAHHAKLGWANTKSDLFDKALQAYHEVSGVQQSARAVRLGLTVDGRFRSAAVNGITLKKVETWSDVIKLARELAERAKNEAPQPAPGRQQKLASEGEGEGEGEFRPDNRPDYTNDAYSNAWGLPPVTASGEPPGKLLNPDNPDRIAMQSLRRLGMRRRPELEGTVPSAWHRLPLDQKLFKGAAMKGGNRGRGTVLVDMSGSMSWNAEDVHALLEQLPECTVIGYCGARVSGRLVLLADRGMAATPEAIYDWHYRQRHGNCVDAPALELLARMPAPRIWVSDGCVTGRGDCRSDKVNAICNAAMKAGDIVRIRHGSHVAPYLKGDLSHAHYHDKVFGD